jgi:hypothetical protein
MAGVTQRTFVVVALALIAACGDLEGFGGPTPPLATIRLETTGQLVPPDDAPVEKLQLALVYGGQWLTEPLCFLPPPSPEVAAVIEAGCPDTFGFVPERVTQNIPIEAGVPAAMDLFDLPAADVMVGDVTGRVAYASLVVYDDRNGSGTLELGQPNRFPSGNDPGPGMPTPRDIVYGASFSSMTLPDQRLAFREGAFDGRAAFFPRAGCGDPLPAFSILAAGGFTPEAALAALLQGKLPEQDPATCSELPLDEAIVSIALQPAGALKEVACEPRRSDSSVRYREPPDESPNLDLHLFACTQIPSFEGGNEDTMQLVVASNETDRCKGLTHYVLNGCDEDALCALPEWDHRASPPAWWPCPMPSAVTGPRSPSTTTGARSPPAEERR